MLGFLKKIVIYLIPLLGIMYGYQYMTGKSLSTLPGEIVDKLQQKDTSGKSTNPVYYSDPEKQLPKD